MSRRMDCTLAFDAPAEKIYQDFTSRHFWDALNDAYRRLTPQSEVTRFTTAESGTDIVVKHLLPRSELPSVARAVMPVDMVITREQLILSNITMLFDAEEAFMADWIAKHH